MWLHRFDRSLPSLQRGSRLKESYGNYSVLTSSLQKHYSSIQLALNSKYNTSMMRRLSSYDWLFLENCDLCVAQSLTEWNLLRRGKKTDYQNVLSQRSGVSQHTCEVWAQELQRKRTSPGTQRCWWTVYETVNFIFDVPPNFHVTNPYLIWITIVNLSRITEPLRNKRMFTEFFNLKCAIFVTINY